MNKEEKKRLVAKRDEAVQKIRQAEADLYYLQGYLKAIEDEIAEAESEKDDKNEKANN